MPKKPSGLTPRQKMELKKGKGKKGITLKGDVGVKRLMGGGTARRPMMAKSGKYTSMKLTPAQKRNLKAGKGKKGITLKGDAGVKKLRRGGKV